MVQGDVTEKLLKTQHFSNFIVRTRLTNKKEQIDLENQDWTGRWNVRYSLFKIKVLFVQKKFTGRYAVCASDSMKKLGRKKRKVNKALT